MYQDSKILNLWYIIIKAYNINSSICNTKNIGKTQIMLIILQCIPFNWSTSGLNVNYLNAFFNLSKLHFILNTIIDLSEKKVKGINYARFLDIIHDINFTTKFLELL